MLLIYGKGKVGKGIAVLCEKQGISYEMADDSETVDYTRYDTIIPSPGVPSHHNVYKTHKVKSELDFAYEFLPDGFKIIAVTGTDGKSTTSWIIYELLRQEFGDKKVYLSGNFDIPFSETVRTILEKGHKRGYIIVEVSSFMSYHLERFAPDYTIFTNFKPDHLNWHKDLQDYLDAKLNLARRAKKTTIINMQVLDFAKENHLTLGANISQRIFTSKAQVFPGTKTPLRDRTDGEDIVISGRRKYKLSETRFSGMHNALNILACTLVTNEMKICSKHVKTYLKNITGLPHRIEFVTTHKGVDFIDDSKSTSCQSLMAALTAFDKNRTILIAGGSDKGDTFDGFESALSGVKYGVLIGATRNVLAQRFLQANVPYIFAEDMHEAVTLAFTQSGEGDTILLSPGCASFGLFRDYLDRAEKFREAIKKLP